MAGSPLSGTSLGFGKRRSRQVSELFTDLYRYRQREKKNNLEDWLTECVAAILRALPKPVFAAFASGLTGQSADSIANVFEDVSIATQVTIDRGTQGSQRPDLLISIAAPDEGDRKKPSQPWLLFENKVFHHVDERNWIRAKSKISFIAMELGCPYRTLTGPTLPRHLSSLPMGRRRQTISASTDALILLMVHSCECARHGVHSQNSSMK